MAFAGSQLLGVPVSSRPTGSLSTKDGPTTAAGRHGAPVEIGSYTTSKLRPSVTFDIADQGWIANRDGPDMFGLIP